MTIPPSPRLRVIQRPLFSRGERGEDSMKQLEEITGAIIDAAMKIHIGLGPGLLESVYEVVLARDLEKRGFRVERQKSVPFEYDGIVFEEGFRVDLFVEDRVLVELKSVKKLSPVHAKQLLTYLRLMKLSVGLLINFGGATLKEGLHRIVNNYSHTPLRDEPAVARHRRGSAVEIFIGCQPGFLAVISNVFPKVCVLLRASHKMIEWFLLPEFAFFAEMLIDSKSCVVQPRVTLRNQCVFRTERCEQMNMIRHDDEIAHAVSFSIKMQQ